MGNMLKDSFEQIHAEEALKARTEEMIFKKTHGYTRHPRNYQFPYKTLAAVCICFFFLIIFGNWLYFTPTSEINIDINPSLELGVNRFNKIISVEGLNEDGQALTNQLNLKYKNYKEALQQILSNKVIEDLLAHGNEAMITVTGSNEDQSTKICSEIETSAYGYTSCHKLSYDEASKAHELGLSFGKYQAFLQLKALDPSFTPEEIQGMTTSEIKELIAKLSKTQNTNQTPINGNNTNSVQPQNNSEIIENTNTQGHHYENESESHHGNGTGHHSE